MSYKSPIEIIENMTDKIIQEKEEYVLNVVWQTGVNVDKDELIRALHYDRGQYEKGYADGMKDAIPIEWIENWKKGKTSIEQVVADKIMMDYKHRDYWEKENETN